MPYRHSSSITQGPWVSGLQENAVDAPGFFIVEVQHSFVALKLSAVGS